jgi:hypothetical protein
MKLTKFTSKVEAKLKEEGFGHYEEVAMDRAQSNCFFIEAQGFTAVVGATTLHTITKGKPKEAYQILLDLHALDIESLPI